MATQHRKQVFPAHSGTLLGTGKNAQNPNAGLPNGPAGPMAQKGKESKNHKAGPRSQNLQSHNEKGPSKRIVQNNNSTGRRGGKASLSPGAPGKKVDDKQNKGEIFKPNLAATDKTLD